MFYSAFSRFFIFTVFLLSQIIAFAPDQLRARNFSPEEGVMTNEIYLAGGCFWGVQEYFSRIPGVVSSTAGYARSRVPNPSYRQVCGGQTGAAETVRVVYDPSRVSLATLVRQYFKIIDPFSVNRQGNDVGSQYRTGVYYSDAAQRPELERLFAEKTREYGRPLAVELLPVENFYDAEVEHQDYLKKNPGGYCHISFDSLKDLPANGDDLKSRLSPMEYHVTQQNGTEPPFTGKYWDTDEPGIYVDIINGEPLFLSTKKFISSCGWPSFTAPVADSAVREKLDQSHGMIRTEVRADKSDSHLGHVFNDGPNGSLRYCINSASLRFVPLSDMKKEGYGDYLKYFSNK